MPPTDDAHHRDWVEAALYAEEKVLWAGNAGSRRALRKNGTLWRCAALLIAAACMPFLPAFWLDNLFPAASHVHLSLWGVAWVPLVIGAFAYLYYRYRLTKQIVYAITNRRALIIERNVFGDEEVRAYNIFRYIKCKEIGRGRGDLIFATETKTYRQRGEERMTVYQMGFFGIDNVRAVEDLMHETFGGARIGKSL